MERLPSNRRRQKVPPERRKRVSKACDECHFRRIKCTGGRPCTACHASNRNCVYPSTSETITISRATYESMRENEQLLRACLVAAVPSSQKRQDLMRKVRQKDEVVPVIEQVEPNPACFGSEDLIDGGRFLADPDGQSRFIGSASGAAFLDQIRQFVVSVSPLLSGTDGVSRRSQIDEAFGNLLGMYQTFDSRPLVLPKVDPYLLPPHEEAERLLLSLCCSTQATNGIQIYFWGPVMEILREVYSAKTLGGDFLDTITLATLNSALAFATQQATVITSESARVYFARATLLLGRPLEATTKRHITCLLFLGCYLFGEHRRDGAYSYIRMAGHLAVTYGFHQSQMTGEGEKRLFWTIYSLERLLSSLLGRPPMIKDDDISVDLPTESPDLPHPDGLRLHVQLAKIIGQAVEKIYGYGGKGSHTPKLTHICESLDSLERWRSDLPLSFDLSLCSVSTSERELLSLHMTYNHAIILVTRQPFFLAIRRTVAQSFVNSAEINLTNESLISQCRSAADRNTQLFCQLVDTATAEDTSAGTLDYHHAFNAAIILDLARLLDRNGISPLQNKLQVQFTMKMLSSAAEKGSAFIQDCFVVLTNLHMFVEELLRVLSRVGQTTVVKSPHHQPLPLDTSSLGDSGEQSGFDMGSIAGDLMFGDSEMFSEFTSWLDDGIF